MNISPIPTHSLVVALVFVYIIFKIIARSIDELEFVLSVEDKVRAQEPTCCKILVNINSIT